PASMHRGNKSGTVKAAQVPGLILTPHASYFAAVALCALGIPTVRARDSRPHVVELLSSRLSPRADASRSRCRRGACCANGELSRKSVSPRGTKALIRPELWAARASSDAPFADKAHVRPPPLRPKQNHIVFFWSAALHPRRADRHAGNGKAFR